MASLLLVLASSPHSPAGQRALALAESLAGQGHALTICCLQDAVLLASSRAPGEARAAIGRLLDRGARCAVLIEDLRLRGLQEGARVSAVDHAGIVALLTAEHDRVIGAL